MPPKEVIKKMGPESVCVSVAALKKKKKKACQH
jgi:hypothetical protein